MKRQFPFLASALLALSFSSFLFGQSPTLELSRGRQGDFWSASMTGAPGAPGLLGLDFTPGPTMSAIGTLGLGLSSDFLLVPFTLNASGEASVSALPTLDPSTLGTQIYAQAGVQNLAAPFWIDLTSTESSTLKGPRYFFEQRTAPSPFSPPTFTATIVAHEVGVPNPLWSRTFPEGSPIDTMVFSAKHNLLLSCRVASSTTQNLDALDGDTGATVFSMSGLFGSLWQSPDEDEVFLTSSGNIARISLPSGTVTANISVPSNLGEFLQIESGPGPNGYVLSRTTVWPVNFVTNTVGPPLLQSAATRNLSSMRTSGTRLAVLARDSTGSPFNGGALHVYDTSTNLPVTGSPLILSPASNGIQDFAMRPVASGVTTYGVLTGATSPSLRTVEEGPLRVTNTSAGLPALTMHVDASPEGNFWVTSGGGGTVFLDISTFVTLNVGPLIGANAGTGIVATNPSDTANGVFNTVSTSPTTIESFFLPTTPVALPISLGSVARNGNLVTATNDR